MNKTERRILLNIVRRLQGERASDEVKAAFTGPCRLYLETWIIPALESLAQEGRTRFDLTLADRLTE